MFTDIPLFIYMFMMLALGYLMVNNLIGSVQNFFLRKLFHVVAFIVFAPGIINAQNSRPRMMVFAFNCVTVALIYLETFRHAGFLPKPVSDWFKRFSEGREHLPQNIIMTHIYLLMGCAFSFTASYCLMQGGQFDKHWTVWSLSGIVFLGVGDTMAAVMGKAYG